MKVNWGTVGNLIGKAAPIIGGLVGGPLGASAGALVSNVLGCENTPEAVEQELKTNPEAYAKLKAAQLTHKTALAELALKEKQAIIDLEKTNITSGSQDIGNVNDTMKEEAKLQHPWSGAWRPFWGFASAVAFFVCVFGLMIIVWGAVKTKDSVTLSHIPALVSSLAMLFTVPGAILGVASWHRGQKQRILAGEVKQPGIMGALSTVISKVGN